MTTTLHPQLEEDCIEIGRFKLCRLLMMNDSNYPWFILVPDRENITEAYQLDETDQMELFIEVMRFGEKVMAEFQGDKLNIGSLGNIVSQLHVHIIVRYKTDPAWPKPVWGAVEPVPYKPKQINAIKSKLANFFV